MRWLSIILFGVACSNEAPRPSLEGPYTCGPKTCGTGQVCVVVSSGSRCGVNDAGVGEYQEYSWTCVDLPAACDGYPSCDCVGGGALCFGVSEDARRIDYGCI